MFELPLASWSEATSQKQLTLRFAKHIWNDYEPKEERHHAKRLVIRLRAGSKQKHTSTAVKPESKSIWKVSKRSTTVPRPCRVKVARFQYGGPDSRVEGKYKDVITLEAPCLQPTCANCWKCHVHLMCSPVDISRLNIHHVHEQGSTDSTRPHLEPKKNMVATEIGTDWTVDLCTLHRRGAMHQRHTKLMFTSKEGKARFRALVKEQASKQKQRNRRCSQRLESRLLQDNYNIKDRDFAAGPRRRHRVKLNFKTEHGTANYKRLVERYLR